MLTTRAWAAMACVLSLGSLFTQAQEKTNPRAKLETAIPEAIRFLEAKDHVGLLKNFVAPDDLKRITEKTPLEEFAAKFGEAKAGKLLEVLKAIKGKTPELDPTGSIAGFALPEELRTGGRAKIEFLKVEELWYIRN